MKLIRFSVGDGPVSFGVVIADQAIAFDVLQSRAGLALACLRDSRAYLRSLPESEQLAKDLATWGAAHRAQFSQDEMMPLDSVKLHTPVEVAALFDFGLTPRHLANSIQTMQKYERDNPQTSGLLDAMHKMLLAPRPAAGAGQPERLSYYKCNLNALAGNKETVPWPIYTSYLDLEPELAVVYGNGAQPVAGYCIFNDVSARDVQAPEIIGGFCLSKDMGKGNQLGPYLVTADEVGNAFDLKVTVAVDGQVRYTGVTAEISHRPEDMIRWLSLICPLEPGSVMGMGTIPDCTGLDIDSFVDPGAHIAITIERLGTLETTFEKPAQKLLPSRWPVRDALRNYHG